MITTLDGLLAAPKQKIPYTRTTARTSIATAWFGVWDLAGDPGAGVLDVGNTANGLVPTDSTAGYPRINDFGSGATGYLSGVQYGNIVAGRLFLYDRLFHAGDYAFNANTTLASQPSYSSRIPLVNGVADYNGLEIWIECVTAFTGNLSVVVTYVTADGSANHNTGTFATGTALTVGRMMQLPLQAGDSGLQKIVSVVATVASAGTFNVLVLRPLWMGRVGIANDGAVHGPDRVGLPVVFTDSALQLAVNADSTSTGIPDLLIDVANG
jgi:hypothetical protein